MESNWCTSPTSVRMPIEKVVAAVSVFTRVASDVATPTPPAAQAAKLGWWPRAHSIAPSCIIVGESASSA
eukprot:1798461-Pleurochrysis_carterae.AAC.1